MLRGAVPYKGVWLAPGSKALAMLQEAKKPEEFKALDTHLRETDKAEEKRRAG